MVGIHRQGAVGVRLTLRRQIKRILLGKGREFRDDFIPVLVPFEAHTLPPELCRTEAEVPVGQLERRIDSLVGLKGLLGGYAAFKYISVIIGIIADIISHKFGSALDEGEISLYHRLITLGAVQKLREIDDVRLLPYKEGAHIRGSLATPGVSHLHPPYAFEPLALSDAAGDRLHALIPGKSALQQVLVSPKGKLGLMPPYHFHMRASVPRIISQAGLLGRIAATAVDGKKILAEHHPTLQFRGPGVGASAEVHYPAFVPELVPISLGCITRNKDIGTLHTQRAFKAELGAERPAVPLRHKAYRIPSAPA